MKEKGREHVSIIIALLLEKKKDNYYRASEV